MSYRTVDIAQTTTAKRYYDVTCDGCGQPLKPSLGVNVSEDGGWDHLGPDMAVSLRLYGPYGSTWDDYDGSFFLCEERCVLAFQGLFGRIHAHMRAWRDDEDARWR